MYKWGSPNAVMGLTAASKDAISNSTCALTFTFFTYTLRKGINFFIPPSYV